MKFNSYFWATVATSFALTACNKSDVAPTGPTTSSLTEVNLTMGNNTSSKTSITPNSDQFGNTSLWVVEWSTNDMVGGWCEGVYNPFTMKKMYSVKDATFEGEVADESTARYIYPYDASSVNGEVYSVDFSKQLSDTLFLESSNNMVMVSDAGSESFKHKTSMIRVNITPQSHIAPTRIAKIEVSGKNISSSATLDLSNNSSQLVGDGNGAISIIPSGNGLLSDSNFLSFSFVAPPFIFADGESLNVTLWIETEDDGSDYPYVGKQKYNFTKTNDSGEDKVFAAGKMSTIILDQLGEDATVAPEPYTGLFGEGTSENPYLISSRSDLLAINELLTADLVVDNALTSTDEDNNAKGKHFKLTQNIDLNGEETVIGSAQEHEFRGCFDGCGFSIYNNTKALFGAIFSDGVVKNLNISNKISDPEGSEIASVAIYNRGLIQNCVSNGSINAKSHLAGFVVYNSGGSILECVNKTAITGSEGNNGGLVANIVNDGSHPCIINCCNIGTISAPDSTGGIWGYAFDDAATTIVNCYNWSVINDTKIDDNINVGPIGGNSSENFKYSNVYYNKDAQYLSNLNNFFKTGETKQIPKVTKGMYKEQFVTYLSENKYNNDAIKNLGYKYCGWTNQLGLYPFPVSGTTTKIVEEEVAPTESWMTKISKNFSGGRGTKQNPYLIGSPEELCRFAFVNDSNCYYKLICDIDLSGYTWTPVFAVEDDHFIQDNFEIYNIYCSGYNTTTSIFEEE